MPNLFVGIDLTDSYAKTPRAVDVATLDGQTGRVAFDHFCWPAEAAGCEPAVVRVVAAMGRNDTVFIIDGPQALAKMQNNTRLVERHLGTPGHTPWRAPDPLTRPFAGYIRTSIEFFNALVEAGFNLAELGDAEKSANLFEAYPGAAWPLWHRCTEPLQSKSTVSGRNQRRAILEAVGCNFGNTGDLTHDQLDAGICAALGWRFFFPGGADWLVELSPPPTPPVVRSLAVFRDANGILREGRMLMPQVALPPKRPPAKRLQPAPRLGLAAPQTAGQMQFPQCDWVYFATPARANQTETYDLAVQEELIVRTVYNAAGQRIANVQHIEPGHTLLLVFGHGNSYHALCCCRIGNPDVPLRRHQHLFSGCALADRTLQRRLSAAGYSTDPVMNQLTIIPVTDIRDLQNIAQNVGHPSGNNTLWRWNDVFQPSRS